MNNLPKDMKSLLEEIENLRVSLFKGDCFGAENDDMNTVAGE